MSWSWSDMRHRQCTSPQDPGSLWPLQSWRQSHPTAFDSQSHSESPKSPDRPIKQKQVNDLLSSFTHTLKYFFLSFSLCCFCFFLPPLPFFLSFCVTNSRSSSSSDAFPYEFHIKLNELAHSLVLQLVRAQCFQSSRVVLLHLIQLFQRRPFLPKHQRI